MDRLETELAWGVSECSETLAYHLLDFLGLNQVRTPQNSIKSLHRQHLKVTLKSETTIITPLPHTSVQVWTTGDYTRAALTTHLENNCILGNVLLLFYALFLL